MTFCYRQTLKGRDGDLRLGSFFILFHNCRPLTFVTESFTLDLARSCFSSSEDVIGNTNPQTILENHEYFLKACVR